ncbi:MAG: efflux RND transporter periplasmic adaptor subunit [Sporomusaceae bacterium]|nr:efflux RND transporter periplasmic adaptor subunit [Sporomusaceae bacterium]
MNLDFLQVLKKEKRLSVIGAGVIGLGIIGGGFFWWSQHKQVQVVSEEAVVVRTAVIGKNGAAQGYTYAGEVKGRYESQLAFQVNGKIIKRNVQLGSAVQAGDILMQIDSRDLQQTVNSSSAQVYSAESQRVLAESNLNRYQQLLDKGAISRAQYDQYVNAYNVAVAGVRQASAQYVQGENQLDYSYLKADKSGVISAITAEAGQVVSAGQVVVTVVQDGEREIEISVPENRVEELRRAGTIQISFWALPGVTAAGQVREIAPMADPTTRTFKVRISVTNPPEAMKLGMTAAVTILGDSVQQTVAVPLAAIYQDGDTPKVWVVENDIVTLRPVQIGNFGNGTVQVVGGLQAGEQIVTAGVHKLKEGQQVKAGGDSL